MQSGKLLTYFIDELKGHEENTCILDIFVNFYNKYLLTVGSDNQLVMWDFLVPEIQNKAKFST
jgi:hypothetical protein